MKERPIIKGRSIIRGMLLHCCVICSIASIIIRVLDWYNPYMDFSGHAVFVPYLLYFSVITLAVMEGNGGKSRKPVTRKRP